MEVLFPNPCAACSNHARGTIEISSISHAYHHIGRSDQLLKIGQKIRVFRLAVSANNLSHFCFC